MGNLRFKLDWPSLIVGSKFTVFVLFYFVFEGNFQVQAPWGLIFRGAILRRVFMLPVWGAYIWRGLYTEGLIFGILRYLATETIFCRLDGKDGHGLKIEKN